MARTKTNTVAPAPLHARLLDGFDVKSRADGTVHTVKSDKATVAECCVGTKAVRLNLRAVPKGAPRNVKLVGRSKSWSGGGVIVTEANLAAARALLSALVAAPTATASPTPRVARPRSSRKATAAA